MGINIIDKRNVKRDSSTENRNRFLKRIKQTIKEQIPRIINKRSLRDTDSKGGNIRVNGKSISEPEIYHGYGGNTDRVHPGNKEYIEGDLISKPKKGGRGEQKKASKDQQDGEDDFIVELTRDEFLNYLFDDLELPDMVKTQLTKLKEIVRENAGFQVDGSPNRLSVIRSYKNALARAITTDAAIEKKIKNLTEIKNKIEKNDLIDLIDSIVLNNQTINLGEFDFNNDTELNKLCVNIDLEISKLIKYKTNQPLFEEMDLRYRSVKTHEIPLAHATMIMIMDNSGSMGEKEKTIARKFFWLLFMFLNKVYDQVDMVFISHTESAEILDEAEFFNTRKNGGTVVSSALDLASNVINKLEGKTNVYVAQVSDGDNWETDNGTCSEILEDDILPRVRYYAYIQVDDYHSEESIGSLLKFSDRGLWTTYKSVSSKYPKLQIRRVSNESNIYPVFRELFSKNGKSKE